MTVFGYCKSDPDIPIGELDYGFIGKCEDVNKLQKILGILRSGEEGRYPELERFTEEQLAKKNPNSPLLEKLNKEKMLQDLPKDEVMKTIDKLNEISSIPLVKNLGNGTIDENLPPIRNSKGTECMKKKDPPEVEVLNKPKNPVPQSPEYWEKLNKQVDAKDGDDEEFESICKEKLNSTCVNNDSSLTKPAHELLTKEKLNTDILQNDTTASALNEKNKGNEAFRCGDFKEALIYYDRSLDILPSAASYNNKAITLIKLENFQEALDACEMVISLEPNNIKALLRRGIANQSLKYFEKAMEDFGKVVELEPTNKRGKELLEKASKGLDQFNSSQKKKGHRIKIEEVTTSSPTTIDEFSDNIKANKEDSNIKQDENCKIKNENNITVNDHQEGPVDVKKTTASENVNNNLTKSCFTEKCGNNVAKENEKFTHKDEENEVAEKKVSHVHGSELADTENIKCGTLNEGEKEIIVKGTVVKELPVNVVNMKNKGNESFKAGQYDKACEMYTNCINELLENKSGHEQFLATFFSNRASCQARMGNSKQCISDCDHSIKLSQSSKVYSKRAKAYEDSEKYLNAYVDYQNAHKMDPSSVNPLQSCSRLGNVLRSQYGDNWREKLPKLDIIHVNASMFNNTGSIDTKQVSAEKNNETLSKTLETLNDKNVSSDEIQGENQVPPPPVKCVPVHNETNDSCIPKVQNPSTPLAKEQQPSNNEKDKRGFGDIKITKEKLAKEKKVLDFFETKDKGNSCVQRGQFEEAIQCYTKCVEYLPNEIPSYTNRALCYLKLKQPEKAIEDCSHALTLRPNCVKALFRRAQARKILKEYKEALADLTKVLKLEPNNNAAKKEMELCKSEFHAALRNIQAENEAAKLRDVKGKGKKVPIEEVTSESAEFSAKGKTSTKFGKCPLAKESPARNNQSKKMTGFEFLHAWNNVKSKKTTDYAELLMQIDPTKLVDLLSNKLDGEILKNFIHTVNEHFTSKDAFRRGVQLLKSLCKASRFVTMLMFLNTTEKALLRSTIESLENRAKQTTEKSLISDINSLRVSYQCS